MLNNFDIVEKEFRNLELKTNHTSHLFNNASVLLANLLTDELRLNSSKKIIELGSGIGHVSIVLSKIFFNSEVKGIEIQKDIFDLSVENNLLNCGKAEFINDDVKNVSSHYSTEFFDIVISNPPHYFEDSGHVSPLNDRKKARTFNNTNEAELFYSSASYLLKNKGKAYFVIHPAIFLDSIYFMRKHKLEPVIMYNAYGKLEKEVQLIALIARKNGGKSFKIPSPVLLK